MASKHNDRLFGYNGVEPGYPTLFNQIAKKFEIYEFKVNGKKVERHKMNEKNYPNLAVKAAIGGYNGFRLIQTGDHTYYVKGQMVSQVLTEKIVTYQLKDQNAKVLTISQFEDVFYNSANGLKIVDLHNDKTDKELHLYYLSLIHI